MRLRIAVLASFLTIALSGPSPVFSKGKQPPEPEDQEETQIQEEDMTENPPPVHPETAELPADKESLEKKSTARDEPPPESGEETPEAMVPAQAAAEEAPARVPEGATVRVVWVWQESRDCLWNLAKEVYQDPWQWKKIYIENRNSILNPNVIFPKQKIIIPSSAPADR